MQTKFDFVLSESANRLFQMDFPFIEGHIELCLSSSAMVPAVTEPNIFSPSPLLTTILSVILESVLAKSVMVLSS